MVRIPDLTDTPPQKRMGVARGSILLGPVARSRLAADPELAATAKLAAVQAAKDAARLLPSHAPFQLTGAFCDLAPSADGAECTVTVQGFARTTLEAPALCGVAAGLLALWDACRGDEADAQGQFPGTAIRDVRVVQNVTG